ncbi:hypothetical protein QUF54_08795, partial [Candidatus Marithioploca araucensis]|nr:hypothetical protein [Candidatus Marithioploca araucensis]
LDFFGVQRFSFGIFLEFFFLVPKAKALDSKRPGLEQMMNLTVTKEGALTFLMRKVGKKKTLPTLPKSLNYASVQYIQTDAEYKAAMQSYLSRPAYLLSDPSQKYPQRETLYDRDIMLR